ncbi:hypothetical protein ACIPT2_00385 [Pectobacterium brasiliense]|uniref:hypothetical protein n=1 Tax=Pectobacterium brasiliense TaxID=180957 RepID=UPI0038123721
MLYDIISLEVLLSKEKNKSNLYRGENREVQRAEGGVTKGNHFNKLDKEWITTGIFQIQKYREVTSIADATKQASAGRY